MSNITTYSTEYHISPVFLLIFLVLLGFMYHLIRNKGYKDTLIASIIIGFILGLIFNTSPDLVKTLKADLFFIILVIIGGFLSVSIKKLANSSNTKQNDTPTPKKPLKIYSWWNKQKPKSQAIIITIICLFSLIIITSTYSLSNPVKDPVQLTLYPDIYSGEINLEKTFNNNKGNVFFMTSNTTKFTFNGSSEPNTTVKITVNELGIYNQSVQLDPNNNFSYNLSIPKNVSVIEIAVEATKPGKDNTVVTLYLKR